MTTAPATASPANRMLSVLQTHIGADKGITAIALAGRLGLPERKIRHLITELREDGIAVCGHPAHGYYIAETAEELEATIDFLKGRALCSLQLASRMSKVPLPDLLGQLHLPT